MCVCVTISINMYEWSVCIIICSPLFYHCYSHCTIADLRTALSHGGSQCYCCNCLHLFAAKLVFPLFCFYILFLPLRKVWKTRKTCFTYDYVSSLSCSDLVSFLLPFTSCTSHQNTRSLSLYNSLVSYIYYVFAAHSHFSPQFECISQT